MRQRLAGGEAHRAVLDLAAEQDGEAIDGAARLGEVGVEGVSAAAMAFGEGEVMDGAAEEHVSEAARVLSRYCDLIAVRAFPKFQDWSVDRQDLVIKSFAKYATVPVINALTDGFHLLIEHARPTSDTACLLLHG